MFPFEIALRILAALKTRSQQGKPGGKPIPGAAPNAEDMAIIAMLEARERRLGKSGSVT